MAERRKQITFDLNQALLKQKYPRRKLNLSEDYYLKAYTDIKRYMLKNGFVWIQQSVYESRKPMSIPVVIEFMDLMNQKMPWLVVTANDIVATDVIAKKYNIKDMLQKLDARDRRNAELISEEEHKPALQTLIGEAENLKANYPEETEQKDVRPLDER